MIWYFNVWISNDGIRSWIPLYVAFFLASSSIPFHSVASRPFGLYYICRYFKLYIDCLFFFFSDMTVIGCISVCLCHCLCYPNANGYFRLFIIRLKFSFPIQLHWSDVFSMCRRFDIYVRILHTYIISQCIIKSDRAHILWVQGTCKPHSFLWLLNFNSFFFTIFRIHMSVFSQSVI